MARHFALNDASTELVQMTAAKLAMVQLSKRFERRGHEVLAIQDLNVEVQAGEFVSIVGPSGCGKTTLLRLAAGLEPEELERLLRKKLRELQGKKRTKKKIL